MHKIEKCCENLLNSKNPKDSVSMIASVLNNIIEDNGIFHVMEPACGCYCDRFLKGSCTNICQPCSHYADCNNCDLDNYDCDCSYKYKGETLNYYNPMHLRLGTEENAAVLIGRPAWIYQFPDYLNYDGPILIVSSDDLLRVINIKLNAYCIENDLELSNYGPKQLNKELFTNDLCLYHYHTKIHKTYTFEYLDMEGKKRNVILLKISNKQYKLLHNKAKDIDRASLYAVEYSINYYDKNQYRSFIHALKQLGNTVHTLYKKSKQTCFD